MVDPESSFASESASAILSYLTRLSTSSEKFPQALNALLCSKDYSDFVSSLQGQRLVDFLDFLDLAIDAIRMDNDLFQKCLRSLRRICGRVRQLPTSCVILSGLVTRGDLPMASGRLADVWMASYHDRLVAIKNFRIYGSGDINLVKKKVFKEIVTWKRLSHPNVLTFLGISSTVFPLSMVSGWMPHGNIIQYLGVHPEANRVELLLDVAKGLEYLHSSHVVHENLKGSNVVIDELKHAQLADFGLSSIFSESLALTASSVADSPGTARWVAPELLDPELYMTQPTAASDIYAFAMVVIEVFSGKVPFHYLRNFVVIVRVLRGDRPARPEKGVVLGLSNDIWKMVQQCWKQEPYQRPTASEVVRHFVRAAADFTPPFSDESPEIFGADGKFNYTSQAAQGSPTPPSPDSPSYRELDLSSGYNSTPSPSIQDASTTRSQHEPLFQHGVAPKHFDATAGDIIRILQHALALQNDVTGQVVGKEVVDVLDQAINDPSTSIALARSYLGALTKICGRIGILPYSHMLMETVSISGDTPIASGAFGVVWKGEYNGRLVAIKALRITLASDLEKLKKKFCKEVVIWKRLSHPNVVRFLGVSTTLLPLCMVSEWMAQGNVRGYVQSHPEANRLDLLVDVARGLDYLHSSDVVHGDLKGDNILVNDAGRAALCDFGLASLATTFNTLTSATGVGGSVRWMAPELFNIRDLGHETIRSSQASDVYALSMVAIEVYTGEIPFPKFRNETVMYKTIRNVRPKKPENAPKLGMSDVVWKTVKACWHHDAVKRPKMSSVLGRFLYAAAGLEQFEGAIPTRPESPFRKMLSRFRGSLGHKTTWF